MCAFFYSEAPSSETKPHGFARVAHMQDRHGSLGGCIVATNRDANNGMQRLCTTCTPAAIMDELEELGFGARCTMIWDPKGRIATIYPAGVASDYDHIRYVIAASETDLDQDDVCAALDRTYDENLCNPSGRTIKMWSDGKLISRAEDEIERKHPAKAVRRQRRGFGVASNSRAAARAVEGPDDRQCSAARLQAKPADRQR
jgi:hypothetical protein